MDLKLPYVSLDNNKNNFGNYEEVRKEIEENLFIFDLEVQIATIAKFIIEENEKVSEDEEPIAKIDIWFEQDSGSPYLSMFFYDKNGEPLEDYDYISTEITTLNNDQLKKIIESNIPSGFANINTLLLDLYKTFFGPDKGARYYNEKKSIEFGEKLDMTLENKPEKKSLKL